MSGRPLRVTICVTFIVLISLVIGEFAFIVARCVNLP